MTYCLYRVVPVYKFQIFLGFILLCGYFVDYLLRYNMSGALVSYASFMVCAFGAIIVKTVIDDE